MKPGSPLNQPGVGAVAEPLTPTEALASEMDLASRWLGGSVLSASDESFGEKENLLNPNAAAFEPGRYGNRGEIVDGWETRRRRDPGHDWALLRLGSPGIIAALDVDTSFFTGNFPEFCKVEGCGWEGYPSPKELLASETEWIELLPHSALKGDAHNKFRVADNRRFTHVRLSIFPDGGVARLRVFGTPLPDPRLFDGLTIDLASQQNGGLVIASSDGFYGSARVLNRPDRARTMGEGWETRRRRDDGHDFAIIQLAMAGEIRQIEVDTAHFKYNASAEVAIYGCSSGALEFADPSAWTPLIPRTRLQPDTRHVFPVTVDHRIASSVRIDAFPDGGISRVRIRGAIDSAARRRAGYRWFNSLPSKQAVHCLAALGISAEAAARLAALRPFSEGGMQEALRQHLSASIATNGGKEIQEAVQAMVEGHRP